MSLKIDPACIKHQGYFLELDGTYLPCCWLLTDWKAIDELKELYGEDWDKLKIQNNSPEEIEKLWQKIVDTWYDKPISRCAIMCPKKGRFAEYE